VYLTLEMAFMYRKDHSFVEVLEVLEVYCAISWICARLMNCQTESTMVMMKMTRRAGRFVCVSVMSFSLAMDIF
jgi:hypothetical protein